MSIDPRAPLYDPAFEHDACGVGFVADAGGRSGTRVLPLALAGLAALRHRGAVAADGESSDGAGVLLPLSPALRARIGMGLARSDALVSVQLPASVRAAAAGRGVLEDALSSAGLARCAWRRVPIRAETLGPSARASLPRLEQAVVARPAALSAAAFDLALIVARRRAEAGARAAGLDAFAIASASARTVVYKALVSGERLSEFYPDLAVPLSLPFAVFHQRFATNTHPTWRLAQPFRWLAHNGEINTVRGNREEVRGRTRDLVRTAAGQALLAAGPLLSPDASDSLSLDECLELLLATGWPIEAALTALVPEAAALRRAPVPGPVAAEPGGPVGPWDGPGAFVFADGRRVGALVDRNGLRPLAYAVTDAKLVAAASEAGAVPVRAAETVRRGRLGPGELLLVDPGRRLILEDTDAKRAIGQWRERPRRRPGALVTIEPVPSPEQARQARPSTPLPLRYLAGLDAERHRLAIRTMAVERHEPLWSMGDDTPTPALAAVNRPVADHLRQAFAQVTNPPIDPERERVVIDLSVTLGRRVPLLAGPRAASGAAIHVERPVVADLGSLVARLGPRRVRWLDATWNRRSGAEGLERRLDAITRSATRAARSGAAVVVLSDRHLSLDRLPIPSVLAVGAVHSALTAAGLRGRTDVAAEAADVLDVHALAMDLAAGATVVEPWLALELAGELGGGRGAEDRSGDELESSLLDAFEAGLRKILARMGISAAASYVGGSQFEPVELAADVLRRCFPAAAGWPGIIGFEAIATRQLDRAAEAVALATKAPERLPDRGLARFRADGERHLYAPRIVGEIQALADSPADGAGEALDRYRDRLGRPRSVVRDAFVLGPARGTRPVAIDSVEPASSIVRRFVASAMSVGALSPEAHQAVTIGMQRAGGAANTGEGGEDPSWYAAAADGSRRDARIKQVASARFGVTATYLARAEQLEIKIAQGSKPGEGGQLPGRKATAYIAALRRAQPGQSLISPPPHHDIYSIEDLAQLITDLRAINPTARIGVKLVAARGLGTIASGVAKAGADYIHVAGHAGGTGASPLSSIKHVGAPWELGLAEVHQTLVRNDLRDRVVLRADGGLQTGRDIVIAGLLGAEEVALGTALLVAIGCDMARQCHLDTCPTGIATQREDLRAKFAGSPDQVERFVTRLAEDVRRELSVLGATSFGAIVGRAADHVRIASAATLDLESVVRGGRWSPSPTRRVDRWSGSAGIRRADGSVAESRLLAALRRGEPIPSRVAIETADRSFGAAIAGAVERRELEPPVAVEVIGSAGQSFGAFLPSGVRVVLTGQANDYVAKGLSGGTVVVRPEPDLAASVATLVGNTCLYGATGGRLHVIGRAGMRFAVRNSGAAAVVEGVGAHGCEYMTGGTVVVLGPVGANFGAGMTGGRAFLLDSSGGGVARVHADGVAVARLADAVRVRSDAADLVATLRALLVAHAGWGSPAARALLDRALPLEEIWLVEPIGATPGVAVATEPEPELARA